MRQRLAKRDQPALSPINTDILTAMPNHCLALARSNNATGAERAFQAAMTEPGQIENIKLDYAKFLAATNRPVEALHKLHELVAGNCSPAELWRAGAEIVLGRPDFLKFALDWTGEAIRYVGDDPDTAAHCAEALMLNGDTAAAGELWEHIWEKGQQPGAFAALRPLREVVFAFRPKRFGLTFSPDGKPYANSTSALPCPEKRQSNAGNYRHSR
ncbi:MAG TPA: hypothetical protein VGY56_11980 [Verrucomicrobiae bacterium]|nr:hypothetical protein [Verrucomicrobiae bacterium]